MLDIAHGRIVYVHRIGVLARHVAEMLPRNATVLDVGSGDGLLAKRVLERRPDLRIRGVDVMVRPESHIPVELFDGTNLPFADGQFDAAMMVDVLHHATEEEQQVRLVAEMARVSRHVLIKDHVVRGLFARAILSLMDWVGNARHGVSLPYTFWTPEEWNRAFAAARLEPVEYRDRLGLYPWPASLILERRMHFIAALKPTA